MELDSKLSDNKNEMDTPKPAQANIGENQDFLSFNLQQTTSTTTAQNNYPSQMKDFTPNSRSIKLNSPTMQRDAFNPQGFSSPIVQQCRFNNTTTPRQQNHRWKHPYNNRGGGGRTPYHQKGDWKTSNRDDKV